jgi:LacI family transcriptional regulator
MGGAVTLREVSRRAGVSTFTVSRALAGGEGVATETRERVAAIARELGYVPNRMASNFRSATSHLVGVLTANSENLFYAGLIAAFQRRMQAKGYNCSITDAFEDGAYSARSEDLFIDTMLEQRAAGVVLAYGPSATNLARLKAMQIPLVFVDCVPPVEAKASGVTTDSFAAAREAGEVFAAAGRRNWLFVGHPAGFSTREGREAGFQAAASEAGATIAVVEGRNDPASAQTSVTDWLRTNRADAILCSNEVLLNGTLRALDAAGLAVPHDVAVISFDDFPWAELLAPPATVIAQPTHEMGEIAADLLLKRISAPESEAERVVLQPRLIRRKST